MRLISVSTGQVQTIHVGNEVIQTAHIKTPAPRPWVITEDGALGDRRAVHPDKLYAFSRAAYDYWGEYLCVDPNKWPDGFFGENLTLDTLNEDDLRVGDVFALGNEVRIVVSGARTPCVKLAWRLSQPRSFQKIFALSRRSGAYFGVLATGQVRPGDRLVRLHREPDLPTIANLCDWVASHGPPPLKPLERLLAFEHLSPTIRLLLGAKLDAAERASALVEARWRGWRPFTIERIVDETAGVRSFTLRPKDGERLCQPRPGQFVAVRMVAADGSEITRSWSLSSFAHGLDRYRLTVRRQEGFGSSWLHAASEGAELMLRAPAGDFVLDMGSFRPVVLVAAGIGITPLFAMVEAHLSRPDPPPLHLIYGARTPAEVAFKAELDRIAANTPDVHVSYLYSGCEVDGRPRSRIDPRLVVERLAGLHVKLDGRRIQLPWYESDMYLCGPGDFCGSLKQDLIALGANPDHISLERFAAPELATSELSAAEIRFARSGTAAMWRANDELTLLEVAEQAGVEVASDCRAGACLTCKTRLIEGATTADTGNGSALLCIGRPTSSLLVLDV